jgi:hypothetical protein
MTYRKDKQFTPKNIGYYIKMWIGVEINKNFILARRK